MRTLQISALAAAATLSLSAQAAPTFYNSEAAFMAAAAGIPLTTETFNNYSGSNTKNITNLASGLNISSNADLSDANDDVNCADNGKGKGKGKDKDNGNCISFSTPKKGSSQEFTFDSGAINAFGLFLGDLATTGWSTLMLKTSNGDTTSYSLNSGRGSDRYYFGLVDLAATFTSVTLTNSAENDLVYIDNVSWGKGNVVPEPGILAMLGLGLAGVAVARRRRQA